MNFVIPMAGRGDRFRKAGYEVPKLLLPAFGRTLLEWSVDSLPLSLASRLIFIGLDEHRRDVEPLIFRRYRSYCPRCVWLPEVTRGQAETVLMASEDWDCDAPLVIFNIDTAFSSSSLAGTLQRDDVDGVLGSFRSTEPRFSFAAVDEHGIVRDVKEKIAISDRALTGLYHFRATAAFAEIAGDVVRRGETTKGEFYVAPLYNQLIAQGQSFVLDTCDSVSILGTPEEYESFLAAGSPEPSPVLL